jgi:hypothetical protein
MSEKAKNAKMKDLEPKTNAKSVKGGICCVPCDTDTAYRVADKVAAKVRQTLDPR